ncbi:hypothetical protein ACS0TY_020802 [Phlomoides rotata]
MSDIGSENLQLSSSKLCVEHNVSDSEMNVGNKRRKVSFSTPVAMESENPEAHLEPVVMKRKRTSGHSFKGKLKEETVPEQKRAAKDEDAGSEIDCWRKKIKKKCDIREARLIQKQEEQCQEFHQIWGKKRSDLERDYKLELSIIRFIYGEGKTRTNNKLKLLDGIFEKKLKEHNLLEDMEFKNLKAEHLTAMDEERQKKEHWLACLYGEPKTDDGPESLHLHSEEVGRDISKSLSTDPQNDLGAAFSQTSVLAGVEQFCALPASSESIPGEIRVVELNKEVPPEVPMDYASPVELSSSTSNKGIDTGDAIGVPDALVNLGDETDEAVGLPPVEQILNPPEQTKASWTAHHCTSLLPQASEDPIPCSSISDIIQDIGAQVNPVQEQSTQVTENQIASPFEVAASGHVDTVTVAQSDIELHDQDVAEALQDQDATDLEGQATPSIEVANSEPVDVVNPVQSNISASTVQNCEELVPSCNQPPSIEVESQSHNLERCSSQTAEIAVVSHESASQLGENRDLLSNHFGVGSGSQVNLERISSQTAEITDATSQLGGNRELQSNHFGIGSESQVIHESSFEASASASSRNNVNVSHTVELQHQAGLQLGIPGNLYGPGPGNHFSHHQVTSFSSPLLHASPLQHELGKISKEIEQLQKSHEDMKSQLRSDCEKEIKEILAQINSKYDLKHQEAEAEFSHKRNGLEKNRNIVLMNKLLAESFSSCFRDLSWLRGIQQAAPSSYMQNQTLQPLVRPPPMAMNHHPVLGQPITTANIQQLLLSNPTRHPPQNAPAFSFASSSQPLRPSPLQTPPNAPAFSFASSSQPLRPSSLQTPPNAPAFSFASSSQPLRPSPLQTPPNAPAFSFASSSQPLRPSSLQTPPNAPAFSFASSSQPLRPSPLQTPPNAPAFSFASSSQPLRPSSLQTPPNAPAFSFASSSQPLRPSPLQTPPNAPAFSFASSSQPLRPSSLQTPPNAPAFSFASSSQPLRPSPLQTPPNAPAFSFASSSQPLRPLLINSITPTPNSHYGGNVRSGAPHLQPYAASFMPTPTVPSTFQHSQTLPPPPSTSQLRPQHQGEPPALLNPPSSAPTHMDDRPNIPASLCLPQINSRFGSLEQSLLGLLLKYKMDVCVCPTSVVNKEEKTCLCYKDVVFCPTSYRSKGEKPS